MIRRRRSAKGYESAALPPETGSVHGRVRAQLEKRGELIVRKASVSISDANGQKPAALCFTPVTKYEWCGWRAGLSSSRHKRPYAGRRRGRLHTALFHQRWQALRHAGLHVGSTTSLICTGTFDMASMMPAAMTFPQTLARIGSV